MERGRSTLETSLSQALSPEDTRPWADVVAEICRDHGLEAAGKTRQSGVVFRKNGLRLRISPRKASNGTGLLCEVSLPYPNVECLELIFAPKNSLHSLRFVDRHVIMEQDAADVAQLESIVKGAADLEVLIGSQERPSKLGDLLQAVPRVTYDEDQLDEEAMEDLREKLQRVRVLQVSTSFVTLVAYLDAVGAQQVFEVKPHLLGSTAERMSALAVLVDFSPCLRSTLIILNADVLRQDEVSYTAFVCVLHRLNLLPQFTGGRVILWHTGAVRLAENPLPIIALPDIHRKTYSPLLETAGIPVTPCTLSNLSSLMETGIPPGEATAHLQRESRLLQCDNDYHGSAFVGESPHTPLEDPRSVLRDMVLNAREVAAKHLVGHTDIVNAVIRDLIKWFIRGTSHPLTLCFCGPSGVGKNQLAKVLALLTKALFGLLRDQYLSFDAAGVVSRHSFWSLTGVPAGLKGMHKPGLLESMSPGGVLAINELDKAPEGNDLQDLLISLLDEGSFRNGHGTFVRLPPCVIVVTLNAGSHAEAEKWQRIGFVADPGIEAVKKHYEDFYTRKFHPALRGRIHKAYFFGPLRGEELMELGLRELEKARDNLTKTLGCSWPLKDNKAEMGRLIEGLDPSIGARGLVKAVEDLIDHTVDAILENGDSQGPY